MSTISENIIAVANQKLADQQKVEDAKAAIRLKGVDVSVDAKLGDLDAKIALIDEWVAPADWIQLPEPNDNEILLLASDINPYYAFAVNVTGGYSVNWGDGTVDNWANGATASHTYTVGAGQACSRGYTTFKIRICAQVPANSIWAYSTKVNTNVRTTVSNGLLWAKFGTRYLYQFTQHFGNRTNPIVKSTYLESVEYPENMPISGGVSFGDTCKYAYSLQNYRAPKYTNNAIADFDQSFNETLIRKIDLSGFYSVTYFLSAFYSCSRLKEIKLPQNFSYGSNQGGSFAGVPCEEIIFPPIINTLNGGIFSGFKGKRIYFNPTHENKIVALNGFFIGCVYLNKLEFVNTVNLLNNSIMDFMNSCVLLRSFRFPTNTGVTIVDARNIFYNCYNMETITNFPPMNSVTNYTGAFYSCSKLVSVDNLDQLGDTTTGMNLETTYTGCYSLNPVGGLKIRNKIITRIVIQGVDANNKAALQALLFTNPGAVSTWAGASPQIDISYCSMEAAALNALFTSIIATSASFSGKTIRITGNPGAATCDTTIITNAGGTVNKTT